MKSLLLLVALLVLFERDFAQVVISPGSFTQLAPRQTVLSGSLNSGQVLFYNFNGFTPGACWTISEDASFDLLYGSFADNGTLLSTGDFSVSGSASDSGNIKLGVTGWSDFSFEGDHTRSGTFDLNMTVGERINDGNNQFSQAVQLPAGQRSYVSELLPVPSGLPSGCTVGDVDFVTFTLPVGACWSTQITRSFDEIFGLYAPNGTLITTADSSLSGVVDSTGTVTIAISGWNDNRFVGAHSHSGSYNLTINTQTPGEQTDNTFATRTILQPGVVTAAGDLWALTGSSCALGDVDFYEFTLTPGVCAQTTITRNFDEVFGLFANNGTKLQHQDSQITTKVDASGKLVIAISGWPDTNFLGAHTLTGTYNFTINTFQSSSDGNNVFANASVVDGSTSRSYISTLEPNSSPCTSNNGDVDFVTFTNLPVGQCFYTLMNRGFDEILGWYDSNGTLIVYQDSQIVGKVPGNGQVTIAVSGWFDSSFVGSHSTSGNYNLTIVTVAPTASDGDDSLATRTILPSGVTTYASNLSATAAAPCNTVGDIDYLEFQVSPGACFSTSTTSSFDAMLGWVDLTNGTIYTVQDSGDISGFTPSNGKLVLAVTGYRDTSLRGEHGQSGNYTVTIQTSTASSDASESPSQPTFSPTTTVSGDLYPSTPGCGSADKDFFLFLLPAGSCFFTNQTVGFDEWMGAFYSNGTNFASGDSSVSGFVPQDGVLIVGITGYPDFSFTGAHTRTGTYRITVNTETVPFDGDDTFQTARIVNNASPVSGSISSYTRCQGAGDVDYVTFTNLTPGACFQTTVVSNFTSGQYLLGRFNSTGGLLEYSYSQFTDIVPSNGIVTLAVTGSGDTTFVGSHTSKGSYTLSLNISVNPIVEDGNDVYANATILAVNVTSYSGNLFAVQDTTPCTQDNRNSDVDFVKFQIAANCYYSAVLSSTFDGYLGLYNSSGQRIDGQDSGIINNQADSTGMVTFAVTAWPDTTFIGSHTSNGNYTLTLTLDCGNAPEGFGRVRGGGVSTSGNLQSGFVDRWTFENQTAGACFVTNTDASFDAVVGWYSDTGSLNEYSDWSVTAIIPESGQVNIAISGWPDTNFTGAHTRSGPYTLALAITKNAPPPPPDGNDNFNQRVTVNGTSVSGSIWATVDSTPCPNDHNTINDVDYYEFVGLPAGYCAATRMDETFDSALALLNSNGTIVDWQDYTLYTIVPSNGVVNIAVTGYPDRNLTGDHQKNGNYTLNLDLTRNQPAPASDNNNNFFQPSVVNVNTFTVSGSIWSLSDQTPCPNDFTPAGDVDYYRFGPYTPGYCFQTQINSTFDEYLGWFSNQGLLLDEQDYQLTGLVPADGFLYIAVSGYRDSQFNGNHQHNGNYTLSIRLTHNTPPPASDNNDKFNSSQRLTVGQTSITGAIWATIDQTPCPNDHNTVNDVDFYTFQGLEIGSCFEINEDATFDQVIGQYNRSGGLVQWADSTLYGVVPSDGIVYLAVSGWADTTFEGKHQQNGNYTLRLHLTKNDAPGERNDNVFADRRILSAAVNKASGDIWYIRDRTPCPDDQPPSDVDFFTFTGLPADTCFRTRTDTNFDTIIGWYGNDGLQLSWSDSEIYGIIPQDGVVNIALSAWADWWFIGDHTNGGRYTVTLELDPDCGGFGSGSTGQAQWCSIGCMGKQCGLDACGLNSCGSCSVGTVCTQEGVCSANCTTVCTPGQECGSDGCGGYCGFCSGQQDVCSGGQCVCVPDCSGRECGDDGCGGSCGVCSGVQEQCFDGICRCVANCTGHECGNDGCGGICGVCGPYYTCGDEHQCVRDPLTQPSCDDYFGLPHQEVNLVLLQQVNEMLRDKILETIDNLEAMKDALLAYDPDAQLLDLANLIDQIHLFCSGPYKNDTCLSLAEFEFIETAFLNAIHLVTIDPLSECAGRVCGTTSYGGSCGSCPTGQTCTEDGQCACVYDCSGRVCGEARQENGTSLSLCPTRSCGTCQDRYECNSYQCTPIPHVPVTLRILDCDSNRPVNVDGVISISHGAGPMTQYQVAPGMNTTWNPELQEGTWNFGISAIGYVSDSQNVTVEWETTGIDFCLHRSTVSVTVRDEADASSIQNACQISIMIGSVSWSQTTPPNPWILTIPDYGYGMYSFGVNCLGYDEERFSVQIDSSTETVHLDLNRTPVLLSVVDCDSLQLLAVNHSIDISSTFSTYVTSFAFTNSTTALWVPPTIGIYDFSASAHGYVSAGESRQVEWNTTNLSFCLTRQSFLVGVREQGASYVTSTCRVTSTSPVNQIGTITPPNPFQVLVPDNGLGTWNFEASCDGFVTAQSSFTIDSSTALVELTVFRPIVEIEVRQQNGNQLIGVNASIQITGLAYNFTFSYVTATSNKWTAPSLGDFTFTTDATGYALNTEMRTITATTTIITLYVFGCGDGVCSEGETFDFCPQDCAAILLQFERYDSNSPVTGYTVTTYNNDPRTFGGVNGPVPNNEPVVMMRTLSNSSNVLSLSSFNRNQIVYLKVSNTDYIDFYWVANMSQYETASGQFFTLRGHLSPTFTSSDLPYRVINTWRTTDNEPSPYAPTDLNLHLFFADGTACDYITVNATQQGAIACRSISDSKQSGGPAAIEFSLSANSNVTIFNSKPPRNPALAPSQANRYLINSGSYVVIYGITADSSSGKQLSQVLLADTLMVTEGSNAFDLWRIADISSAQPQQGDIQVTAVNFLGSGMVDENSELTFDCQINSACASYTVPFVDAGGE